MNIDFNHFPNDETNSDPTAYINAIHSMRPRKDICFIFTPDHTHFEIALAAIEHGLHVYVAKPLVQKLEHHIQLMKIANRKQVLVGVEVHKRWDPIYSDAWAKIRNIEKFGDFSYFTSYMSQPYTQLNTFSSWIVNSDINYYLNAHHIDFHCWCLTEGIDKFNKNSNSAEFWRPVLVTANGSEGKAKEIHNQVKYDSITLLVKWIKFSSSCEDSNQINYNQERVGTAVYTASWIAPKRGDVFSQQRFFYQGTLSEFTVDQAHRGYTHLNDQDGYQSVNPLFMKYTPDARGYFAGQTGYGYRSLETFIDCASAVNLGERTINEIVQNGEIASVASISTILATAILNAGKISLDNNRAVEISYDDISDILSYPPSLK